MSTLTQLEKETIILFNEAEGTASIDTFNQKLQRKLKDLSLKYPSEIKLIRRDNFGATTYQIPKILISIRQPVSEKQRKAARERALKFKFMPQNKKDNM